jgi:hypothetical protein
VVVTILLMLLIQDYSEGGPPVDIADRLNASLPMQLVLSLSRVISQVNKQADK